MVYRFVFLYLALFAYRAVAGVIFLENTVVRSYRADFLFSHGNFSYKTDVYF
jgi:hypothetical protein